MPSKRRLEVPGVISRRPDARSNDTAGRGLTRIRPESEKARAHGTFGADPPDPLGEGRHGHSVDVAGLTPHFTHSVASVLDSRASLKEGANHNHKVGSFPWTTGSLRYGVNLNRIRHLHLCRSPPYQPRTEGARARRCRQSDLGCSLSCDGRKVESERPSVRRRRWQNDDAEISVHVNGEMPVVAEPHTVGRLLIRLRSARGRRCGLPEVRCPEVCGTADPERTR